jgi:cell shape-determining protein MreD
MMAWWQDYGWKAYELLWAVVAVAGLVVAIRRRRQPAARWAVAALAVMLLPGVHSLVAHILWVLALDEVDWAKTWHQRLTGMALGQLFHAAGFALLVPAIFAGRTPIPPADPDAE